MAFDLWERIKKARAVANAHAQPRAKPGQEWRSGHEFLELPCW